MQDKINITAKGHNLTVTSKSLTIDDKEYLYKGITAIKHSPAKQIYAFKYDGNWEMLRYDDDSEKKIVAIFKQIAELIKKRKAAEKKAEEPVVEEPKVEEPVVEEPVAEEPAAEIEPAAEEPVVEEAPVAEEPAVEEVATEEPKAEEPVAEEAKPADPDEITKALLDVEGIEPEDTEIKRKSKLKKAIIILVIVLAVFVAAGIAYFFIFGPSSDASQSPNTDTTHQYNDIEELIDEMQE